MGKLDRFDDLMGSLLKGLEHLRDQIQWGCPQEGWVRTCEERLYEAWHEVALHEGHPRLEWVGLIPGDHAWAYKVVHRHPLSEMDLTSMVPADVTTLEPSGPHGLWSGRCECGVVMVGMKETQDDQSDQV